MDGAFARAEREHLSRAWLASRVGWLAQADPRKQPTIRELAGLAAAEPETLTAEESAAALKAWAKARGA